MSEESRLAPHTAVLVAGPLDSAGEDGLALQVAFLARLGVRAAPVASRFVGPPRASDPIDLALFRDQLRRAVDVHTSGLRAVLAGGPLDASQAEMLLEVATEHGLPFVVDPWAGLAVAVVAAATLLTPDESEAAALSAEAWDGTRDGLLRLARGLVGPARTCAVTGGAAGGETVPVAIAGPGGERIVEAPRDRRGALRGAGGAMAACAAGYIALGLPPFDAAAAAHRFVAAAACAAHGGRGRPPCPEPWSV